MSNDIQIDKDRAYASQCYLKVRWYCPVCVLQKKIKKHCKIHKTPASWWWHIKNEHGKFVNRKFGYDDLRVISNYLVNALEWGIFLESVSIPVEQATTTSSLLYRGRLPRKDVYQKLEKIASILQLQSEHYPHYRLKNIRKFMGIVLGKVDDRTIKNYLDCIVDASEKNITKGTVDVTQFCSEFNSRV